MSFDPSKQYRCIIIRGKAKNDLDNLLPKYASIIAGICLCPKAEFTTLFNKELGALVSGGKKTLDNHRTEIAGKLFGMYFEKDETIYPSERTLYFLENEDQPAFFKDICFKFQFPNGMDSVTTLEEKIKNKICLRQFPFILELLKLTEDEKEPISLNKNEIAYFVLNNAEVLKGEVSPSQVLQSIKQYRNKNIQVKISVPGKAPSYTMQHINEQLNLLELANLVRSADGYLVLNPLEENAINYIRSFAGKKPEFDIYSYDFSKPDERRQLYEDWQMHYSKLDKNGVEVFKTTFEAIKFNLKGELHKPAGEETDLMRLGDDGERFVYEYEKGRVAKYDTRLTNKVLLLGKTKGLGYDIQSIIADGSGESEFVKYIEVKASKRVTAPDTNKDDWTDTINLTRNEWVAATQHKNSFSIFRVYFTSEKTIAFIMNNPHKKAEDGILKCIPTNYRLDFSNRAVDFKIE